MKYVFISGIIILIGFVIALHFIPIGIEPLIEVYIENYTSLPKFIFSDRFYNFTFTVHNLEYKEMNYTYNVWAQYGNQTWQINEVNFTLQNNQTSSFFEIFSLEKNFDKAKMIVNVKKDNNKTIDIDFLVEEIKGPTITITP